MTTAESLTATIKELKKDTDERIERLKVSVKEVKETRQTQTGQQPHQS